MSIAEFQKLINPFQNCRNQIPQCSNIWKVIFRIFYNIFIAGVDSEVKCLATVTTERISGRMTVIASNPASAAEKIIYGRAQNW